MKTPFGTEVDLGPCHIVLNGVPAPAKGAQQHLSFRPMSIVATVAHLSYCRALVQLISRKSAVFLLPVYLTVTYYNLEKYVVFLRPSSIIITEFEVDYVHLF